MQVLYQMDVSTQTADEALGLFFETRRIAPPTRAMAERLVRGVGSHLSQVDAAIARDALNWRIDRMAVVDRSVLRLACYELLFENETPPAAVLNEAVEIAKLYGGETSGAFVNGLLDAIRKRQ